MSSSVLVVGPVPPPVHGAAKVTASMIGAMADAGVAHDVIDTGGSGLGGLSYHRARCAAHVAAAARLLRPGAPRHLYIGGSGGSGLWYQAFVMLVARVRGVPVVFHHHSVAYLDRRSRAMACIVRLGGDRAVHVVLGRSMAEALRVRYPTVPRVLVCSNAALLPAATAAAPREGRSTGVPVTLGLLGNLTAEKGLHVALDVVAVLLRDGHDVRLLLAGPVPGEREQRAVSRAVRRLGDRVEHVGPVAPRDVDTFYDRLDVLLFPTQYVHEAEPLVVLEASRRSVPVVTFARGCLPDMVGDPRRVVAPNGDFASATADLLRDIGDPAVEEEIRRRVAGDYDHRRDEARAALREIIAVLEEDS